jgi:hypothetical protein
VIYALQTNTVGQTLVTATSVTSLPLHSFPNALGISAGGTGLYAVAQSGSSGGATVYGYSTATGTWSTYGGSGGVPSGYVAGAVAPAGIQVSPDGGATVALVCPQTNAGCDASGVLIIHLPGTLATQTIDAFTKASATAARPGSSATTGASA